MRALFECGEEARCESSLIELINQFKLRPYSLLILTHALTTPMQPHSMAGTLPQAVRMREYDVIVADVA